MKLQYIINDISELLVDYYTMIRNIQPSIQKRLIMVSRMKQAILSTYEYMYGDINLVYSIDVFDTPQTHKYILGIDTIYDRNLIDEIMQEMRQHLKTILSSETITIRNNDDVINIHVVPFDEFGITTDDICDVLDLVCL